MCFAVFGFNFLFFVLVLSSNNGWYQFRRRVSVVGLIHCPLLWAWKFLSDLRSPTEFGTLSTISVCLRVCLNLCTYMKSFWCLFRRRSWKTTMPGSWTHWRASNRPIRVQRKLWVQKRWKLDLTNSLFNLSWKIQRCRLAPVWSVVPYLCSLNDHYNITSIVVIFLWGGSGIYNGVKRFNCREESFDIEIWMFITVGSGVILDLVATVWGRVLFFIICIMGNLAINVCYPLSSELCW